MSHYDNESNMNMGRQKDLVLATNEFVYVPDAYVGYDFLRDKNARNVLNYVNDKRIEHSQDACPEG